MRDFEEDDDWDADNEDEDDGYVPCPYCGESMYEESGYCSSCKQWISREDQPRKPMPTWVFALIVMCIVSLVLSALRGF